MRHRISYRLLVLAAAACGVALTPSDARAQSAGTTTAPLPNVLLLVDTSGSMERNVDGTLPTCTPGTTTSPNRWGILLQALTGSIQPGYSCYDQTRVTGSPYALEYQLAGKPPLDVDYSLDHYRPVSGTAVPTDTRCVWAPYRTPGVGGGVGPSQLNEGSGVAEDFPPDSLAQITYQHLTTTYGSSAPGSAGTISPSANACSFLQAGDGQLDIAKDFARFSLMTFDTDPSPGTGTTTPQPATFPWNAQIVSPAANPFPGAFSWLRTCPGDDATWNASIPTPPWGCAPRQNNPGPVSFLPGVDGVYGRPTVSTCTPGSIGGSTTGCPAGTSSCIYTPMEVGARHFAAPPWEGRTVLFPDPNGQLSDIELSTSQIEQVLLNSRPYGGTPIDGMMDDARDYLWYSPWGPNAPSASPYSDPYVKLSNTASNCGRRQYIVLLTDGAPNLDLRPVDPTGTGCKGADCPYPNAYLTAKSLYHDNLLQNVKTFVIGFSVNGAQNYPNNYEGFPSGLGAPHTANTNCKGFYTSASYGNNSPTTMNNLCFNTITTCGTAGDQYNNAGWKVDPASGKCVPPKGSTADACCQLNQIAYEGSGGTGPSSDGLPPIGAFFADTQQDIVTAFSAILATISQTATTRTVPAQLTTATVNGLPTSPVAATYAASFVPDARKPWSGEIIRVRSYCSGLAVTPVVPPAPGKPDPVHGDSYATNLAAQTKNHGRFFITVQGAGPQIDSARTMRPFASNADNTQPANYIGTEVGGLDDSLATGLGATFSQMLNIDDTTCKKASVLRVNPYPLGNTIQSVTMPALTQANCTKVIWDFAVAESGPVTPTGGFDYNFRCPDTGASVSQGRCSISGKTCTVALGAADECHQAPAIQGDTCAPLCTALGAIFRSSPVVVSPPHEILRDDGYQQFAAKRGKRRPTMFVSTTDGVLHGLMALETVDAAIGGALYGGATPGTPPYHEFFAFVPPAALPRLASSFPTGQQILLDGTPAVKDAVWYRDGTSVSPLNDWHTTLVAPFGAAGGGYYALNVSDADCSGNGDTECNGALGWNPAAPGVTVPRALTAGTGGDTSAGRQPGPHFLWQLTDFQQNGAEAAKLARVFQPSGSPPTNFYALFGKQTYTPAIGMLQMKAGATTVQVGVAILPGGIDGSAAKIGSPCTVGVDCCNRAVNGGYSTFGANDIASAALGQPYGPRGQVRKWAKTCNLDPVPGRGVTIVRLDTGEIIRHFGRKTQDVPQRVQGVTINSPFDSPIVGTPAIYPDLPGVPIQKIYVGDADGTIWSIDVSTPCDITNTSTCDPINGGQWRVKLFQDLFGNGILTTSTGAERSTPIALPILATTSPNGSTIINAASGEQENIISSNDENVVISVEDRRALPGTNGQSSFVNWTEILGGGASAGNVSGHPGERVTGPMTVFDRTLYFATDAPAPVGSICAGATQWLWGIDYAAPAGGVGASPANGGDCRWQTVAGAASDSSRGTCNLNTQIFKSNVTPITSGSIIPGVTVQASLACTSSGANDQFTSGLVGMTPSTYTISTGVSTVGGATGTGTNTSKSININRAPPRVSATLDAWAIVSD